MHELYQLKETLMKELEEYGSKRDMNASMLEVVDKLTHTIKNLDKIIEVCEESEGESSRYSGAYDMGGSGRGSYRRSYDGSMANRGRGGSYGSYEGSYARRRDRMGRYAREGGSGRGYSRGGDMVEELRKLMEEAPDERTRQEFQRFIGTIEGNM